MSVTLRTLPAISLAFLVACQASELQRPLDKIDVTDTSVDEDADTSADTGEVETSGLRFWLKTAGDEVACLDERTCELVAADEPAEYASVDGFQVDVHVELRGVDAGTEVELSIDGATAAVGVAAAGPSGLSTIEFTSVTIPEGEGAAVTVSSTDSRGDPLSETKVVSLTIDECDIEVLAEVSEAGCASLAAEGGEVGFDVTVRHAGGVCEGASLSYTFGGNTTDLPHSALDDQGEATFFVSLGLDSEEIEGPVTITARVTHAANAVLDATAAATYQVDNVAPTVTFVQPDPAGPAVVTTADDLDDNATNGIQYAVTGVTDLPPEAADAVELFVDGASVGTTTPGDLGAVAFEVSLTADGTVALALVATDACGNAGETTVSVPVAVSPGAVELIAPADAAVLLAVDDADPATAAVYETTVSVSAPSAPAGAVIAVECAPHSADDGWVTVGSATIDPDNPPVDDVVAVSAAIDTAALGSNVKCRATIDRPNPGVSGAVSWTVAIPAPTLGALTQPTAGACLNSTAWTIAGTATGLDGQPVTVSVADDMGGVAFSESTGAVAAGAYSVGVNVGALSDGAYTISVDASDAAGNLVSATQAPPTVAVTLDATAPVLAFTGPPMTLDPASDAAHADQDDATAGYQTTVTVTMADASVVGGQLCLAVNGVDLSCQDVTAAAGVISWAGVTLQPGANTLSANGSDGCGNAANQLDTTVTLVLDAPGVAITDPAADLLTAAATTDLTATVTHSDGTQGVVGAAVTLLLGGVAQSATATDNGDGTYTFAAVPLVGGANVFTVSADVSGSVGVSGPRTITRKTDTPSITITAPTAGAINRASATCAAGSDDCAIDVEVTTANAEDGSAVRLDVTCDLVARTFDGTVTADAAIFAGLVLADGASCTLQASVTDAAGQAAQSAPVAVTADWTAPVVAITSPATTQLVSNQDLSATDSGIQHPVTAEVSGVEAGQVVTLEIVFTPAGGEATTTTLTHVVASDTPDDAIYVATFEDAPGAGWVSFFDGTYGLSVSVGDAAGNVAAPDTRQVVVQTEEAAVRITFPAYTGDAACDDATPCGSGVCFDDLCWDPWATNEDQSVSVSATGLLTDTDNLRVCSDHASLAGSGAAVCATDIGGGTFYEVARVSTAGGIENVEIGGALPEGYQTIVAEALPLVGGLWQSSATDSQADNRLRRLLVDHTAPQVTAVSSRSDVVAPIDVLNAAEQDAPGRRFDITFEASEAGDAVVFVNGAQRASAEVSAGTTSLEVALDEGDNDVWVVVTDVAGNASAAPPAAGAVVYQVLVDTVAPTVAITRPTSSPLKVGDILDVRVQSDEEGATVSLADAGVGVATAQVVGGFAEFPHATFGVLTDGSHTLTATVTDAAGNSTTAVSAPAVIEVDTMPPAGTINAPADGAILTEVDDASTDPGYQIAVDFSTSSGATAWTLWTAKGCAADFTGCGAPSVRESGVVTNPDDAEPIEVINVDIDAATTHQKLLLETEDAVGNKTMTEVNLTFTIGGCSVAFEDLPGSGWFNGSVCADGVSCANAEVVLAAKLVGICPGVTTIELYDGAVLVASATPTDGRAEFTVTVADGATLQSEAKAMASGLELASTGTVTLRADFTPPQVAFVAADVDGFTTPAAGASVTWTGADDRDQNTAGMQFNARVTVTDSHADGGAITSLGAEGLSAGELTPSNVTLPLTLTGTSPISQDLIDMTLAHGQTYTVTVTAVDAAGNSGTSSFTAVIDVQAPEAVVLSQCVVTDRRRPRLRLDVVAPDSDGAAADRYEVRYSRNPITASNFEMACDAREIPAAGVKIIPSPGAPGTPQVMDIGAPDVRAYSDPCKLDILTERADGSDDEVALYVAVRATDAGGNLSPLTSNSVCQLTHSDLWLRVGRISFRLESILSNLPANLVTLRGAIVGDIDGDGRSDIITGSSSVQAFCVVYGHDLPMESTIDTLSGVNHDCLVDASPLFPGEQVREAGSHLAPLGDVNGDGFDDFAVSGRFGDGAGGFNSEGWVAIYLGSRQRPDLAAPHVRVRGLVSVPHTNAINVPFNAVGPAGDFDGATTGGVLTDDIVLGEPGDNRAHVLPGDGFWNPATTNLVIDLDEDVSNDDSAVRQAHGMLTFDTDFADPSANSRGDLFGNRCGAAGDVLPTPGGGPDGLSDILILQSGEDNARLFVIPGRPITPGASVSLSKDVSSGVLMTPEDAVGVRLRQDANVSAEPGFAATFQGGHDLTLDGVADIIVGHKSRSTVSVFDGADIVSSLGGDHFVGAMLAANPANPAIGTSVAGTNGYALGASVNGEFRSINTIGDFNSWAQGAPTQDLAIGDADGESVELRMNSVGGGISLGAYGVVDGYFENIYQTGDNTQFSVGFWVDGGVDLTGDGRLDIVSGGANGELVIVR